MKRLVVCADGTWNNPTEREDGGGPTNVTLLKRAIADVDPHGVRQVAYYIEGVGNGNWWDRNTGGAFGTGISRNIKRCYQFVVEQYAPGDELFLFGFSRGAYTARSVAGMIRKCGVLKRLDGGAFSARERTLVDDAYEFYRQQGLHTHPNSPAAIAFRAEHSHETGIKCLGVWDTVGALGVPTSGPVGWISRQRHAFHDVKLSSRVQNAFHALAIDERRKPFAPTLWEIPDSDPALVTGTWRIEQRWFAGVHSNVGGGYPDRGLSNIPLRWIMREAQGCGLALVPGALDAIEPGCNCEGTLYDSMSRFYRLLGRYARPVMQQRVDPKTGELLHTFESVDSSVDERCRSTTLRPAYRPTNLTR